MLTVSQERVTGYIRMYTLNKVSHYQLRKNLYWKILSASRNVCQLILYFFFAINDCERSVHSKLAQLKLNNISY